LFDYLCEHNAIAGNPVDGVKRPMANGNEGSTPALGDAQARRLLEAPPADTLKGVRDRAILATLLYHGLRREELCRLRVRDIQSRQGVMHFRIKGKRDKIRFVPVYVTAQWLIQEYLALGGHCRVYAGALFRPINNNVTGELDRPPGVGGLRRAKRTGRPPKLSAAQLRDLERALKRGPEACGFATGLWSAGRVRDLIEYRTGVRYHEDHVWRLLHQLGWSCQRPVGRALARDEAAIRNWKQYRGPRLKKSAAGAAYHYLHRRERTE
jgi:transposase